MYYTEIWLGLCSFLDIIIWTNILLNALFIATVAINAGCQKKLDIYIFFAATSCY